MIELIEAEKLAHAEIVRLVVNPLNQPWKFQWNFEARHFGLCRYDKKIINISMDLAAKNTLSVFKTTLYHEIAHALCPGESHSNVWRAKAIELGSDGNQCFQWKDIDNVNNESAVIPAKGYGLNCPEHGLQKIRFRLSEPQKKLFYLCRRCQRSLQFERIS